MRQAMRPRIRNHASVNVAVKYLHVAHKHENAPQGMPLLIAAR